MAVVRKPILNMPLKIIYTHEGVSQFITDRKRLVKIRLADNTEDLGMELKTIVPASLQKMILVDYISRLEISVPEFATLRQEILDLSKLTVFTLLYKQFDKMVLAEILSTDVIKKHNRTNPTKMFDAKPKPANAFWRSKIQSNQHSYHVIKKILLDPIHKHIMKKTNLNAAEKNIHLLMSEKFLDTMSLYNWFLIISFYNVSGFSRVFIEIQQLLLQFLEKTKLAEYISLMMMELAINNENSNFRKEARLMYRGIANENAIIFDPDIRKKIIAELARKHELVSISWKLGGGAASIGTQGRLQITLYNKEDVFDVIKENFESKKSADLTNKTLIDFYRETPTGQGDNNLGLYYLSYLNEECQKVNVKFESYVNQFSTNDLTVISLTFNF